MALGVDAIHLMNGLKQMGYINGERSVVELGSQQLTASFLAARDVLDETAQLFGARFPFSLPEARPSAIAHGSLTHLSTDAPHARDFWHWLGFRYAAVDIDGTPDSIPLDLNYDTAPSELVGSFQMVTNFGTTEHIANQLNAFKVIHDLAAADGLMVHQVPLQGMLNHGLVNYNVKFFWMLCRGNDYRMITASISRAEASYSLPQNIVDSVASFDHAILERAAEYRFTDTSLTIVLQKHDDVPFVAPLDVSTETLATDSALAERYGPVSVPNIVPAHESPVVQDERPIVDALKHCSGRELQRELLSRYRRRITQWYR